MNFHELMKQYGIDTVEILSERTGLDIQTISPIFYSTKSFYLPDLAKTPYLKTISESLECPLGTLLEAHYESTHAGYTYVMQTRDIHKIGRTNDPKIRHRTLRYDYPALQLIHSIYSNDYSRLERRIHDQFTQYRLVGEWFMLPEHELSLLKSVRVCRFKVWQDD